ncbi:hypothetical protein [Moorena sp. SIO3H5]|uniref:hypothetical protein n=1 Tax=Moorena sp. SIO3H5 TaxID=2607834 RepID=UPI0013BBE337|nr:hypothetical protein [Moorena sp. SIO3H5]NEO70607.1 hypothetical protein [Moorena sp. SIO3H5]
MTKQERQQFVENLARKTMEQVEPESKDLELFDIYSEEYFKYPKKALEGMQVKDRPVGSGFGIGEIILVPILLWLGSKIADKVIDKLLDRGWNLIVEDLSKDKPSNPIIRFLKNILKKFGFKSAAKSTKSTPLDLSILPPLTIVEKQQLRQETLAEPEVKALVSQYNLSDTLIVSLIDAMVANLPAQSQSATVIDYET